MTGRTLFAMMLLCAAAGALAATPAGADTTGSPADECVRLATPPVPLSVTPAEAKAKAVDWPHAIDACEEAVKADANNARLRYLLGNAYFTTKNYILALRHLEVAADAGYPDAQDELGVMFVRGLGVIKDYQRAFDLFNKAAAGGSPAGMGNLGSMYASGFFVKEDDAQALAWYEKSIEAGNAFALAQAGVIYFNGQGTPRDYQMAAGYFQQAADLGDGYSLKFLALMYERGLLGKPDPTKAAELRLKAAEVDPDSQNPDVSPPPEPRGARQRTGGLGGGAGRPAEEYRGSGGGSGGGYIRHAYGVVGVWADPNANKQFYTGAVKRAPTWHNIPIALPRCWPFCSVR
jgi:TPR repeat protein